MLDCCSPAPSVAILVLDGYLGLYSETLRYISWKLRRAGYTTHLIGCTRALSTCTSFNSLANASGPRQDPSAVCRQCIAAQKKISVDQRGLLQPTDLAGLPEANQYLKDVKEVLQSSARPENTFHLKYQGFSLSRYAFFDFSITWKVSAAAVLDHELISAFISGVEDQLRLLHFLESLPDSCQITHLVYVNGNYSLNTLAREYFRRLGVTSISVEPQFTSQRILNHILMVKERLALHPDVLMPMSETGRPLLSPSRQDICCLLGTFRARIRGSDFNAYTTMDVQSLPRAERSSLLAFLAAYSRIHSVFLSSEDELTPHIHTHGLVPTAEATHSLFASQFAFVESLLDQALDSPEIGFVLRLHPRMAKNKRERIESIEHLRYKQLFAERQLPKNVFILYGDSSISSYYLVWKSQLIIIAWSTIGLEALLLGSPVISVFPDHLMYPLSSLSRQPTNPEEMREALFSESGYGAPKDLELVSWMAAAYESQFVPTVAPRGGLSLRAKLYKLIYKVADKLSLHDGLCRVLESFNCFRSAQVRLPLLLQAGRLSGSPTAQASPAFIRSRLDEYRAEQVEAFSRYDRLLSQN